MRNPDRIDPLLKKLGDYWKLNPDLRLGQLISNLSNNVFLGDIFYVEDSLIDSCITMILENNK